MLIITGGAGFIGSRLVKYFNEQGKTDIIVVDHLKNGKKMHNLSGLDIFDYADRQHFIENLDNYNNVEGIYHLGACSVTTEWDGVYMMDNNYNYSKTLLHYCTKQDIPFYYASSAAVYGNSMNFTEKRENEKPVNVYGYSKFLFDEWVRREICRAKNLIVGFRFFNVYGPNEGHKGAMASVPYHWRLQLKANNSIKLFDGYDGYEAGCQRRDFVYVDDIVKVMYWFFNQDRQKSGIYNLGTGKSQTFNEMADAVLQFYQKGTKTYIPFPEHLKGAYQSFTEANIISLRKAGYTDSFKSVTEGVNAYFDELETN